MKTVRDYLDYATCTKEEIDRFLDPSQPNWAQWDPEVGYIMRNAMVRDSIDNAYSVGRYLPTGERIMVNFGDRPCRINTYGDSFTQCHQASDGETWQEVLAAHFCEPIRNFGCGGYGVYQAYRRMRRAEVGAQSGTHVIINIFGDDDHFRSLDTWRWLRVVEWHRMPANKFLFHSCPAEHVRVDMNTGEIVERANLCPTRESLYKLCDKEFVYETFKDDVMLHLQLARRPDFDVPTEQMQRLAEALKVEADFSMPEKLRISAQKIQLAAGLRATCFILDKAQQFTQDHGKKLMVLLSYGGNHIADACQGRPRYDQPLLEFMNERGIPFADSLTKHAEDYKAFNLTPGEYLKRYFHGHYTPLGNTFFAFAVKNAIVEWLDPKPPTYQPGPDSVPFEEFISNP